MEIPEILQKIVTNLDPKSLVAASLVSHHWHKHITPLIWHTIHPQDWTHSLFRPRTLYAQADLVRDFAWHATTSSVYQQAVAARALQLMGMETSAMGTQVVISPPPSSMMMMMTQFDVREGGPFLKPPLQGQQEEQQRDEKEAGQAADTETRNGQVPTTSSHTTTTTPPPIPVLDQLSLICLTKIVAQCVNLQKLSLHTLTSPCDRSDYSAAISGGGGGGLHLGMIPVLQSLVLLQSLELYVNRVVVYQDEDKDQSAGGGGERGGLVRVVDRGIVVQDLVRPLTRLRKLSLRGTAFIFNTSTTTDRDQDKEQKNDKGDDDCFSIRYLTLDTPYISEQELIHLLTHTPALQSLDLPAGLSSWIWSDTFLETLRTYNTNFCEFSINASAQPPIMEDQLVRLVRSGFQKPIRRFGARACMLEEGEIFTALLDQQASAFAVLAEEEGLDPKQVKRERRGLEELDISLAKKVGPLFRERLYDFLRTAKGLKRLEADGVWISTGDLVPSIEQQQQQQQQMQQEQEQEQGQDEEDVEGDAGSIEQQQQDHQPLLQLAQAQAQAQAITPQQLSLPQQQQQQQQQPQHPKYPGFASSKTLTHLHIGFSHPSRPTSSPSSSIHLQNMYSLLATLTNLTHLQLSYTCLNLPSCPFSGFDQLAALKHLRVFNIETCGYPTLGREDVECMVKEVWPGLERLALNQLGASQERVLRGWLKEFGREDLVVESSRPSGMMFF
ncbi:hypothetical protein K457DRAFT_20853 [Linnemannia elongata AG-77]|uniref:F-box domain-containing protein n=1 Tax=Linnemannia elongata AG-77 TaxID=1314771 RepID=A0A197JTT4_9FUNG|nr:hypothetical protein K457DRAFT_20853 [Linnemannia elongata AG-77]